MSSIFSHLLRVSLVSSFTTQRASFYQPSSSSTSSGQQDHYQHGIPGIPNDGKVVLLKNSSNGAQVYLVGTVHFSKQTTQTVKKVINYVRPDAIAVELCESSAKQLLEWRSKDDNLYTLYLESKRARAGLSTKVAMEEASRVGAGCFFIDQDDDVTMQQLSTVSSDSIWQSHENERYVVEAYERFVKANEQLEKEGYTRSLVQEVQSSAKDLFPERFKVIVEDRDKHLFMELRRIQGKIVAVVGIGHMDGIELLWKRAENVDDWQPPANQKCGLPMGMHQGDMQVEGDAGLLQPPQ
ncbi:hypothetical protein MKW92_002779 [Papaver armeniacum]|nr:hypothetical protein MKW92_002779 [Papaver armeniacum]